LNEDIEYLACSVWNNGVVKAWIPSENQVIIYRGEEDGEIDEFLEVIDPNRMQQRLRDASQNKEQYDMTIDDSAHDMILVELVDHDDNARLELLVDPETKLVTLDKQGDEPSTRIEFLAYNQSIDPGLFELNEIPDDARVINQVNE
ncbi:MAG: LolA family protein, partial [Planctomycetota bacterium]